MNRPTRRGVLASFAAAVALPVAGVGALELAPTPVERLAPGEVPDRYGGPAETTGETVDAYGIGRRTPVDDGLGDGPHSVFVGNGADGAREVSVAIARHRRGARRTVAEQTFELDPGRRIGYLLRDPGDYRFHVASGDADGSVRIERRTFDCNDSTTSVVADEASVESELRSTTVGCAR